MKDFPPSPRHQRELLYLEEHDPRRPRQHRRRQRLRRSGILVPLPGRRHLRHRHRWRLLGRSKPLFHQLFLRPYPTTTRIQQG
jgi:hypothetical protein